MFFCSTSHISGVLQHAASGCYAGQHRQNISITAGSSAEQVCSRTQLQYCVCCGGGWGGGFPWPNQFVHCL